MAKNTCTPFTAEKKEAFFNALAETCNVTRSAKKAKVSRMRVYQLRQEDPEFAAAFEKARKLGIEALEDEGVRRAKEGVLKPVFQGGKLVGTVREYSDTLLIFLLKGGDPKKYRDNLNLSGGLAVTTKPEEMTDEQLAAIAAAGSTGVATAPESSK